MWHLSLDQKCCLFGKLVFSYESFRIIRNCTIFSRDEWISSAGSQTPLYLLLTLCRRYWNIVSTLEWLSDSLSFWTKTSEVFETNQPLPDVCQLWAVKLFFLPGFLTNLLICYGFSQTSTSLLDVLIVEMLPKFRTCPRVGFGSRARRTGGAGPSWPRRPRLSARRWTKSTAPNGSQGQIYDRGWVSLACFGKLWGARSRLHRS